MIESLQQLEQVKKSIVDDYKKGIRIDSIISSVGSSFVKKSERKKFVYDTIYEYLIEAKKAL